MEIERRGNELFDLDINTIFKAILVNDVDVVKHGISKGFTAVTKRSETCDMALHFACWNSKLQVLELLKPTLKEGDINTVNVEEDDTICGTALHLSMDGQVDTKVVKLLLDWGADPNARDKKGVTVLYELIYRVWEDSDERFKSENITWEDSDSTEEESLENIDKTPDEVIAMGPDRGIDTVNTNARVIYDRQNIRKEQEDDKTLNRDMENTESVDEVGTSYFKKLELLHQYGADMNFAHFENIMIPIHVFFECYNLSMSEYMRKSIPQWCVHFFEAMVESGADVNIPNDRGQTAVIYLTPLHYTVDDAIFRKSYHDFVRRVLTECDSYENTGVLFGRIMLHESAERSNIVLLEELVKHHSHVNIADKFGMTPLHLSTHCFTKDERAFVREIVTCLMEHGGDINVVDHHGTTPLHHAVSFRNHTAIEVLFSFGALPDIKDKMGLTAKDYAKIKHDDESLKLLGAQCDEYTASESGVSDFEIGLFYPMCCHRKYDAGIKEAQKESQHEPDNVLDRNLDAWLNQFPVCAHNRRSMLQNCIIGLEQNTQQANRSEESAKLMRREIYQLVEMAARAIAKLNPLFECKVLFGGSTAEGTKIGSCDEFDLVFDLFKLRQYLRLEEMTDENVLGFVNLKVTELEIFTTNGIEELVDENGYLKRTETSYFFHKYLEKSLNGKDLWTNNNYHYVRRTTNSRGECFNIGQLNLVWYGPFLRRQDVSVDIVPVFRIADWLPANWNENTTVVNTETARSVGCYLMMKDAKRYVENKRNPDDDIEGLTVVLNNENLLFKVSISQVEHAAMKYLPSAAKLGYMIAKSLRLLSPNIEFHSEIDLRPSDETQVKFIERNGKLYGTIHVMETLTSYTIKTGLFHELESRGVTMNFSPKELHSEHWNRSVLSCDMFDQRVPTYEEIIEAKAWTLNIYKRINAIVAEKKYLPEYFLLNTEATKLPGRSDGFVDVISAYLKCMIYFLEHFETPIDLVEIKRSLV